jgi:hypothetical protein
MSIAKPEQSANGLPNYGYRQVITKILGGAAIGLGLFVGVAAPASADSHLSGTDPNPFGALSCSCQETTSPGGPALREELNRGIRGGLSA